MHSALPFSGSVSRNGIVGSVAVELFFSFHHLDFPFQLILDLLHGIGIEVGIGVVTVAVIVVDFHNFGSRVISEGLGRELFAQIVVKIILDVGENFQMSLYFLESEKLTINRRYLLSILISVLI